MKYLKGTFDFGLEFRKIGDILTEYVDSDYVSNLDKRRSLAGYIFTIRGCVVSWKATLQHTITLCTTKAQYIVITMAVKEPIWLKGLLI